VGARALSEPFTVEHQAQEGKFLTLLIEDLADRVAKRVSEKLTSSPQRVEKMLYNVDEAAIYMGRSESSIRHLIEDRDLPSVKNGGRVQVYKRDMDEWIEKHRR
jgi:excisionase family DNA binding protein